MREFNKIPTSKVQRASKFIKTGAKVGTNYVKHYTKKVFDGSLEKDSLHEANASDIFDSLSELKGGALKVAQMMSFQHVIGVVEKTDNGLCLPPGLDKDVWESFRRTGVGQKKRLPNHAVQFMIRCCPQIVKIR